MCLWNRDYCCHHCGLAASLGVTQDLHTIFSASDREEAQQFKKEPLFYLSLSLKNENVVNLFSPSCRWKVRRSFILHKTFLELHGKTELQHSPKHLH